MKITFEHVFLFAMGMATWCLIIANIVVSQMRDEEKVDKYISEHHCVAREVNSSKMLSYLCDSGVIFNAVKE